MISMIDKFGTKKTRQTCQRQTDLANGRRVQHSQRKRERRSRARQPAPNDTLDDVNTIENAEFGGDDIEMTGRM